MVKLNEKFVEIENVSLPIMQYLQSIKYNLDYSLTLFSTIKP